MHRTDRTVRSWVCSRGVNHFSCLRELCWHVKINLFVPSLMPKNQQPPADVISLQREQRAEYIPATLQDQIGKIAVAKLFALFFQKNKSGKLA